MPSETLPGLDSELSQMVRGGPAAHRSATRAAVSGRVQIEVHLRSEDRADTTSAVAALPEVTKSRNGGEVLQAWVAIEDLERVAAIPGVALVRRPARARALGLPGVGPQRSEGSEFFDVEAWHRAGFRGAGVGIGVIDIGFEGFRDLLGTELPAQTEARSFIDGEQGSDLGGDSVHGAAVAEIVHDVAPDARLALARVDTIADFFDATEWLIEVQGVDVISTSIAYINATPGDGTGVFAEIIQSALDRNVVWSTSAGNSREAHWSGRFRDFDDDDRHDFQGGFDINWGGPGDGQAFFLESDLTFIVYLRWDDWTEVDSGLRPLHLPLGRRGVGSAVRQRWP